MSLVELARFATRIEADLARLALEAEGFDVILFDTEVNSFFGGGGLAAVRLMVLEEQRDDALELLTSDQSG